MTHIAMKSVQLALASLGIFLFSCQQQDRVGDTVELKEEIQSMKIKRITPTQLSSFIHELGIKIASASTISLEKQLNGTNAEQICEDVNKLPIISSLEQEYGVVIQLLLAKDTLNEGLSDKEKELLQAYVYSSQTSEVTDTNIQSIDESTTAVDIPIKKDHAIYKKCKETQSSPIAVWHITFDHKEIIKRVDSKALN